MRLIIPNWPAPKNIKAYSTTREGGVSSGPYESFNLGDYTGDKDNIEAVNQNRQILCRNIGLHSEPHWLRQVHGNKVKLIDSAFKAIIEADASLTRLKEEACVVITADCLPILLCDQAGSVVAAVHAGWKGLVAKIIEATVSNMSCPAENLMAWLGPAISQKHFEVGPEVYEIFGPQYKEAFIVSERPGHFMADIYHIARIQLKALGIKKIYGGEFCTYSDPGFYSYRRDNGVTGRQASLIWKEA
ncbi:MAG: multi-copper polyphenol oxidoreductase [Gammaproteobacteria bacterium]|jgi:YfiH family protein|nr:multi-copper polyphenol oxidoreductase [Gammaproteobacteria bacterium]